MVISVPKAVRRLYFMVMFVAISYLFYCAINLLQGWINPINDYGIQEGSAVKAFHDDSHKDTGLNLEERLRFYYWYGE